MYPGVASVCTCKTIHTMAVKRVLPVRDVLSARAFAVLVVRLLPAFILVLHLAERYAGGLAGLLV